MWLESYGTSPNEIMSALLQDIRVEAGDPEARPVPMSREQAYEILGISDKNTSFDDVLKLKKKLVEDLADDRERLMEVLSLSVLLNDAALFITDQALWTYLGF